MCSAVCCLTVAERLCAAAPPSSTATKEYMCKCRGLSLSYVLVRNGHSRPQLTTKVMAATAAHGNSLQPWQLPRRMRYCTRQARRSQPSTLHDESTLHLHSRILASALPFLVHASQARRSRCRTEVVGMGGRLDDDRVSGRARTRCLMATPRTSLGSFSSRPNRSSSYLRTRQPSIGTQLTASGSGVARPSPARSRAPIRPARPHHTCAFPVHSRRSRHGRPPARSTHHITVLPMGTPHNPPRRSVQGAQHALAVLASAVFAARSLWLKHQLDPGSNGPATSDPPYAGSLGTTKA